MYARTAAQPKRARASDPKMMPAPVAGWIANRALADPRSIDGPGAAILDNYFPRTSTVKLRRGSQLHATLDEVDDPVLALFSYRDGLNTSLFAANETKIYDITTSTPDEELSGFTSGDWSVVQFATTGDVFIVGVNGADVGFLYDGSAFTPLSGITFDGTSLTTADMSFVWTYKNRLWFIEKDSLNAWYMEDADAIGGVAKRLPMAGIFPRGGSLVFGQTWSLETGSQGGLSEQNVFVSTQGEVAVFQGSDPSSADTWAKVGVYRIGTPLGKRAFMHGGGDLAIATSVGLVPLSKAISLDVTSLTPATVSYKISDAWQDAIAQRGLVGWQCELWPEQKMAVVSPPDLIGSSQPVVFVSNAETGAWCRFTNWYALSMEVHAGRLYYGTTNGRIYLANETGSDGEMPYTGTVLPLFDDCGSPSNLKIGKMGRGVSRAAVPVTSRITMKVDYDDHTPLAPDASGTPDESLWGTGEWGLSIWSDGTPSIVNQGWRSIGGAGYALSLAYQVTSGAVGVLDDELIRLEFTYTTAEIVT